jgi:predicted membrane chloride channel (bestrophin family)
MHATHNDSSNLGKLTNETILGERIVHSPLPPPNQIIVTPIIFLQCISITFFIIIFLF